jgi:DNA-binding LacI/PurR family transcriptional regulator
VRQPLRTMGILAAEAIVRQIASPSEHPPSRQVMVDPELIVRDSTYPPPARKAAKS